MIFYRRFIDDVIGIWCPNKNPERDALEWNEFKDKMNSFPGLTWEFSERAKSINFMDMTISINNSNKIETTLFEKDSTCTCTSLHTPPTHQAYFLVSCTALCFEFLPYVQTKSVENSVFSIWIDLFLCRSIQLLVLSYAEMFVYMYLSQLMSTFTNYLKVHHLLDGFFIP